MKYKCIETLTFPNDYYGEDSDEEFITVYANTVWETGKCSGDGEIHLDSEDGLDWLEISREMLKKFFRRTEK